MRRKEKARHWCFGLLEESERQTEAAAHNTHRLGSEHSRRKRLYRKERDQRAARRAACAREGRTSRPRQTWAGVVQTLLPKILLVPKLFVPVEIASRHPHLRASPIGPGIAIFSNINCVDLCDPVGSATFGFHHTIPTFHAAQCHTHHTKALLEVCHSPYCNRGFGLVF